MKIYSVNKVRVIQTHPNFPEHKAATPVNYFITKDLADIWISKQPDLKEELEKDRKLTSLIIKGLYYKIEELEVIGECEEQA